MPFPLWTLVVSVVLLLILFSLLQIEKGNGRRLILVRARAAADLKLVELEAWQKQRSHRLRHFDLRVMLHFVLHQLLGLVLFIIGWTERQINRLRSHNRLVAHEARRTTNPNHLDKIATHKETTALSAAEKTARKERSLNESS